MKPGGGKQKGGQFEREICKILSLWVSQGNSDDLFWRSAMSGGRATVRTKKGQKTTHGQGDISAVTPEGNILTDKFIVECKSYKSLGWDSFIYGKGFIWDTWKKLVISCDNEGKQPFLVLKQNSRPPIAAFRYPTTGNLEGYYAVYPHVETREMSFYYLQTILDLANIQGM